MISLKTAIAQVDARLKPSAPSCLLRGLEPAVSAEGRLQRSLIAAARRLVVEARRKIVLPASEVRPVVLDCDFAAADRLFPRLRLAREWLGFADSVRNLQVLLYRPLVPAPQPQQASERQREPA
eukprot:Opistho-1_new@58465